MHGRFSYVAIVSFCNSFYYDCFSELISIACVLTGRWVLCMVRVTFGFKSCTLSTYIHACTHGPTRLWVAILLALLL